MKHQQETNHFKGSPNAKPSEWCPLHRGEKTKSEPVENKNIKKKKLGSHLLGLVWVGLRFPEEEKQKTTTKNAAQPPPCGRHLLLGDPLHLLHRVPRNLGLSGRARCSEGYGRSPK